MESIVPNNPYVGPRAIRNGEAFFGRDREVRSLSALLIAERIVLLHSPSGAGKSSLIQAGLIPGMAERFKVFPPVRVNLEPPLEAHGAPGLNRYVLSTLVSLEESLPAGERLPLGELAGLSLDAYLEKRSPAGESLENCLLVFDQFEEILTISPTDAPVKQEFFEQVGEALQNRHRWALFSIREDYLGGLNPYVRAIPNRLAVTFRLGLLGPDAARLAIQQPARNVSVEFTDDTAQKLVDDLRRIQVQQPDGSFTTEAGPSIEPVQLQVVCYNLWQSHAADDNVINEDDLQRVGSVDQALAGFYANALQNVAQGAGIDERRLRRWFDDILITPEGIRNQVLKGAEHTEGLPNAALNLLENTHLIRGESRAGKTWYELSHDRLVTPVRKDNSAWFEAHLSLLQQQSTLWERQKRPDSLLLRGKELGKSEEWIRQHSIELLPVEKEFYQACIEEKSRIKREERRKIIITLLAIISSVLACMAIVFAIWGLDRARQAESSAQQADYQANQAAFQAKQAEVQAQLAQAGKLAAQAQIYQSQQLDLSLILAVEAYKRSNGTMQRSSLLTVTGQSPRLQIFLHEHALSVNSVAISPDGKIMASASDDMNIILWDFKSHKPLGDPLTGHGAAVVSVAFSPDGKILASGSRDSSIIFWEVATRKMIGEPLTDHTQTVLAVNFSPDGRLLASGFEDNSIILWDTATRKMVRKLVGDGGSVNAVKFSPNGKILASGYYDGGLIFLDIETGSRLTKPLYGHGGSSITSLAFSPNGERLASGGWDHNIVIWNVLKLAVDGQPLVGHEHAVQTVTFSPNGMVLVSGSADGKIILWDPHAHQRLEPPLTGLSRCIWSVAFNPDGETMVSGSSDGTLIYWDMTAYSSNSTLMGHSSYASSVAYSRDGKILASGSSDGTIMFWDVATHRALSAPISENTYQINNIAFSSDDKLLAAASCGAVDADDSCSQGQVTFYDVASRKQSGDPLKGHTSLVSAVAFSPDGKTLATGSFDYTIILWDVVSRKQSGAQLKESGGSIISLAFSPDGKKLAAGTCSEGDPNRDCIKGKITIWDVASRKILGEPLIAHSDWVTSVAFSPDGKILASGSDDSIILLWDAETGKQIGAPISGHSKEVTSLAFSPDGNTLASGSGDHTTMLWDVATHQLLSSSTSRGLWSVYSVAFSPDGKTLASASCNQKDGGCVQGGIFLWDLDPSSLVESACKRANRNLSRQEWNQYIGETEVYQATCQQYPLDTTSTSTP